MPNLRVIRGLPEEAHGVTGTPLRAMPPGTGASHTWVCILMAYALACALCVAGQ